MLINLLFRKVGLIILLFMGKLITLWCWVTYWLIVHREVVSWLPCYLLLFSPSLLSAWQLQAWSNIYTACVHCTCTCTVYTEFTVHNYKYNFNILLHTVRKEIKCSGDSEILHEIVRDTTQTSSSFSDFRVVSRTISCSTSEYPPYFILFLTVQLTHWYTFWRTGVEAGPRCCLVWRAPEGGTQMRRSGSLHTAHCRVNS